MFGYHLVNTIIHVINGLLVYWLVLLIFRTPRMAGDSAAPYYNLALFYRDRGDTANAVKNLEIYLGIRPDDVEARLVLKELRGEGPGGVK